MQKSVLDALIPLICDGFSYALSAGSTQIIRLLRGPDGNELVNEANDRMSVVSRLVIRTVQNGVAQFDKDSCVRALNDFIAEYCEGRNDDTRGGEVSGEGGTVTVDPTTDNCGC